MLSQPKHWSGVARSAGDLLHRPCIESCLNAVGKSIVSNCQEITQYLAKRKQVTPYLFVLVRLSESLPKIVTPTILRYVPSRKGYLLALVINNSANLTLVGFISAMNIIIRSMNIGSYHRTKQPCPTQLPVATTGRNMKALKCQTLGAAVHTYLCVDLKSSTVS